MFFADIKLFQVICTLCCAAVFICNKPSCTNYSRFSALLAKRYYYGDQFMKHCVFWEPKCQFQLMNQDWNS